jgi:hypothetical protein
MRLLTAAAALDMMMNPDRDPDAGPGPIDTSAIITVEQFAVKIELNAAAAELLVDRLRLAAAYESEKRS